MKKLLIGIIVTILLFGLCAELERESNPDGSTPMTEQMITQMCEGISQGFREIKEGISAMFSSITDSNRKKNENNI